MTLAIIVNYLGHAMLRRHGETTYACQHCGEAYDSLYGPKDWCTAALGAAGRS